MGVSALLTVIFWKKFGIEAEEKKDNTDKIEQKEDSVETISEETSIYAPVKGEVLPISESADEVFASKAMGDGVAINPTENMMYAPADGTISLVFPTGHAVGITLNNGVELLIHAGIDTVKMEGEGFKNFVAVGDTVKKGDKLLSFDRNLIVEKGYQTQTMLLVAKDGGKVLSVMPNEAVDNNTCIMTLK